MKFGRKMILVDYEASKDNLNNNNNYNFSEEKIPRNNTVNRENVTESAAFSFLDREMSDILNLKNISDFDKWKLYRQTLEKSLFHIRSKQQNEIDEAKKFDDALAHIRSKNTDPSIIVQRNIVKQMKPRTIIAKRKISVVNKNPGDISKINTSTTLARRVSTPIEISSDNSDEYLTPVRPFRKLRSRDSKGRVKSKQPSKTAEAIFSKWEQTGASSSHGVNFD